MGTGKTLLAILAIWLARNERGAFSVVVCPASCVKQWSDQFKNNFDLVSPSRSESRASILNRGSRNMLLHLSLSIKAITNGTNR